ncbi:MAG: hypothetical protein EXR62_00945 [Chloroflexi bacterium]|nr:hypothetical protein [Chloroflexota bacterium]
MKLIGNDKFRAAGLFLLAVVARLVLGWLLGMTDLVSGSESGAIAWNLVHGLGYTFDFYGYRPAAALIAYMPPLYTWVLAGALATSAPAAALLMVHALLGGILAVIGYDLASRLCGKGSWLALLTGAALALYPPLLIMSSRPFSTTLHATLLLAWLWSWHRFTSGPAHLRWAILAGVLVGLLALSRSSMAGLAGMGALWWAWRTRPQIQWRAIGLSLLACAAVIFPWSLRNTLALHALVPLTTSAGHTFWNGNNPFTTGSALDVYTTRLNAYAGKQYDPNLGAPATGDSIQEIRPYPLPHSVAPLVAQLDEVALDRSLWQAGAAWAREHPAEWLALTWRKFASLWGFRPNLGRSSPTPGAASPYYAESWILPYQVQYILLLLLALLGMLRMRPWRTAFWDSWGGMALLSLAYLTGVYVAYNVITRYRFEIEPWLILYAAQLLLPATEDECPTYDMGRPTRLGQAFMRSHIKFGNIKGKLTAAILLRQPTFLLRALSGLVGIGLALLFTWLAVSQVDPQTLKTALLAADPFWLALAWLATAAVYLATAWRWRALFQAPGPGFSAPPLLPLLAGLWVAQLFNLILPGKAGPLARAAFLRLRESRTLAFVLGTVLVEKLLEGITLLLVALVLLAINPAYTLLLPPGSLLPLVVVLAVMVLGASLAIQARKGRVASGSGLGIAKPTGPGDTLLLPAYVVHLAHRAPFVERLAAYLLRQWSLLGQTWPAPRAWPGLLGWSLVVWGCTAALNYCLLRALHLNAGWIPVLTLLVVLQAGARIPATPGSFGVFHYLAVVTLGWFGVAQADGLAFGILLHTALFILPALLGVVSLAFSTRAAFQRS